jgi:RNA polymerase sigma-70 factor (ECF subfamily)
MFRSAYRRLSDEDLSRRALGDDVEALHELCERHRSAILRFAQQQVGNQDDAEDITQHVLGEQLRALLGSWERRCTLRTLLLVVARRRCLDHHRAQKPSDPEPAQPRNLTAPDVADEAINRVRLAECFGRLKPRERLALVMRQSDGLSYTEISDVLRASVGTVASLIARARMKLHRCMTE